MKQTSIFRNLTFFALAFEASTGVLTQGLELGGRYPPKLPTSVSPCERTITEWGMVEGGELIAMRPHDGV